MMKCEWCECELTEPEVYCDDCIEMLNASLELTEGVTSDTEEDK